MAETVYHSALPTIHIPTDLSFPQFITRFNPDAVRNDKIVLEDLDVPHDKLTYGGLRTDSAICAGGLASKYGLQVGDAVVIYAENSVAWARLAHAVLWLGGIMVGINHLASESDLPHYLDIARPKLIFTESALRTRMAAAMKNTSTDLSTASLLDLGGGWPDSFPTSCLSAPPLPPLDLTNKDNRQIPAAVIFSSGSSGKPKGVHLSHYNIIAHALGPRSGSPEMQLQHNREVFFPPLAHLFGLSGALLPTAFSGNYVLLMRRFEYRQWIEACSRIQATVIKAVPAIAVAIAKDPQIGKLDLRSVNVMVCAGATLQAEVVGRLQEVLGGVEIVQGYGMSESAVAGLRPHRSAEKQGSVGRLFANTQLRLVDEQMNDVPRNTPGEALLKSPTVFMNYRGNPQATNEAFHNGWLRTGDVLAIDDDDFLWFKDRKKEMIKYKGNQIAPAELEDLLASHPKVLEAAVCAAWDKEQQTEVPVGYVVLDPSVSSREQQSVLAEVRASVDKRVTAYKKLRGGVHAIAALPKNVTGKLARNELPARKEMVKMMAAAAAPKARL